MQKTYNPEDIEARIYADWERRGCFAPSGEGEPYCIMLPPPNVTGTLHMGHAFQDTIMDALTRLQRMRGRNTLWQPGTDHAGIATQMVVERQLNAEGLHRRELGRERFVARVWQWKQESGDTIERQLKRLGASVDWSRHKFTMDAELSRAVTHEFVSLYEEGLIYRGKRLVNWDPVLHTALSDLEVVSEDEQGKLWHFRYPLADGSGHLVVATTRPETMLGDTAVAVHPDDERYAALVGREIELPLTGRRIPIIADDYVDPEFGSGCVKITPAHDFNDYEIGRRHGLATINVLDDDASLNDSVPAAYRGLDRFAARERIVADLDALGLLERTQDHRMFVPRGDRSGAVLEPYLTDQWYVKIAPLAEPAIEAVEDGRVRFVPENWSKTYFEWMRNIQDWCISRQLWWGHRIPAWYDPDGGVHVGLDEADARHRSGLGADVPLAQDEDVLDTWFSSALWPFSTLGWPDKTPALATWYPGSVLVTGFDIIFFWVARMIMMGLKFMGDVPFREVYIHGLVRDGEGQKMSKSKGNVLDPLDLIDGVDLETLVAKRTTGMMQPQLQARIEKATRKEFPDGIPAFGTDALRFTFASLATTGRDVRLDLGRVEGYRNFCNKLWNASRFVLMNTEGQDCGTDGDIELGIADRWIRSRLGAAAHAALEAFDGYRLDLAAQAIYDFTWHEFCDWYLELVKPVLNDDAADPARKRGTRRTLVEVLEALLRLLHPLMPFITEELWQRAAPLAGVTGDTIMLQPYPDAADYPRDESAEAEMAWLQGFVLGLRQVRGEMNIAPGKPLPVLLQDASPRDLAWLAAHRSLLTGLARLESVRPLGDDEPPPPAAAVLLGEMRLLVPMAGLIDAAAEIARLEKQRARLDSDLAKTRAKLDKPSFVDNAPAAVVEKERQRAEELGSAISKIEQQLERVRALA
ncbi:valine--tRNA ligase [Thioalkalivibrio sp. XN279]|uniref:valine--tRNA ligase n=1 Tax=Thioalkalivibrio sp. XN279 TaxID=2714953 RepID=UPI00140C6BF6|nr:valine--tRNA ligase [Thioalkalivibrio sp. XN279]NHA14797.1 valine--tRNA ligase [Thioalkalivibrio sp. XN279]